MDVNQNDNEGSINLKKIDQTYIVRLVGGTHTTKGSFWAFDALSNEYYVGPKLVKNNPEIVDRLFQKKAGYWALIQKVIWGGIWDNQQVEEVMILSQEKNSCESFRTILKSLNEIRLEKVEKVDLLLELIMKLESPSRIKDLENQVVLLDEEIGSITEKLDQFKGWMDLNW